MSDPFGLESLPEPIKALAAAIIFGGLLAQQIRAMLKRLQSSEDGGGEKSEMSGQTNESLQLDLYTLLVKLEERQRSWMDNAITILGRIDAKQDELLLIHRRKFTVEDVEHQVETLARDFSAHAHSDAEQQEKLLDAIREAIQANYSLRRAVERLLREKGA